MSTFLTPKVNNKDKTIPTKISELINDVGYVKDTNYKHTDNNFTDSYKSMLDNTEGTVNVINKANQAANRANIAAEKVEKVKANFPKVINDRWYIYNDETGVYEDTGVRAKGESFRIKKTYKSIIEMNSDSENLEVGDFVLIDSDVNDPDNSKLFVKTEAGMKFLSDLSGSIGITGFSAYEIAVNNGYKGTEQEWIESLSSDSKEAAKIALKTVDKMNVAMSDLSELRYSLETTQNAVIETDNTVKANEQERIAKETEREASETERKNAEEERLTLHGELVELKNTLETTKTDLENTVSETVSNANITVNQLKNTVNNTVEKAELDVSEAISNAESQIATAINNSDEAIGRVNTALSNVDSKITEVNNTIKKAENATADTVAKTEAAAIAINNANLATTNANTQADRAKAYSNNPPSIISGFWYVYDEELKSYVNTNVRAEGLKGDTGTGVTIKGSLNTIADLPTDAKEGDSYLIDGYLYVYVASGGNVSENPAWDNVGKIQGPPGSDATVTKEAVESVLIGNINTHNHNNTYYTKTEIDSKDAPSDNSQYVRYNGEWVKIDLSSVDPYNIELPEQDKMFTKEQYDELLNAINNKRRIVLGDVINPVVVGADSETIRIDYVLDMDYFTAFLYGDILTWDILEYRAATLFDVYDITPKSIDHVPTESDIFYIYDDDTSRYTVGTLVTYNNKFYRLYSITNNKADWREIGSKQDITSKLIKENENPEELNGIFFKLLNYIISYNTGDLVNYPFTASDFNTIRDKIIANGTLENDIYNYHYLTCMRDTSLESFGAFGGTWIIDLSYNSSFISVDGIQISNLDSPYSCKFKFDAESEGIINKNKLILSYATNGTLTTIYTFDSTSITFKEYAKIVDGDGTKFLNDKGEYTTAGVLPLPEEYQDIFEYFNSETGTLTDEQYNKVLEVYNKSKTWYLVEEGSGISNIFFTEGESSIVIYVQSASGPILNSMIITIDKSTKNYGKDIYTSAVEATESGINIVIPDKGKNIILELSGSGSSYLNGQGQYKVPFAPPDELMTTIDLLFSLEVENEVSEATINILNKYLNILYINGASSLHISKDDNDYRIIVTSLSKLEGVYDWWGVVRINYVDSKYKLAELNSNSNFFLSNKGKIYLGGHISNGGAVEIELDTTGEGNKYLSDNGSYSEIKDLQLTKLISTDGVYAVTADLKLVNKSEVTSDCIGIALIDKSQDLAIMFSNYDSPWKSWGFFGTNIEGITEETSGKVNTQILKNLEVSDTDENITTIINSFLSSESALGYDDWYIPSKIEVEKMLSSGYLSEVYSFANDVYIEIPDTWWTSTEVDATSAYIFTEYDNGIGTRAKKNGGNFLFVRDLSNIDSDQINSPLSKFVETNSDKLLKEQQSNIPEGALIYNKENDKLYFNGSEVGRTKVGSLPEELFDAIFNYNEVSSPDIIRKYIPKNKFEVYSYSGPGFEIFLQWLEDDTVYIMAFFIFENFIYNYVFRISTGELKLTDCYYSRIRGNNFDQEGNAKEISLEGGSVSISEEGEETARTYSLDLILNGKGNKYLNDKGKYTEPLVPSDELKTLLTNILGKITGDTITSEEYTLLNNSIGYYVFKAKESKVLLHFNIFAVDTETIGIIAEGGNIWVTCNINSTNNTITELDSTNSFISISNSGIALDIYEIDDSRNIDLHTTGDGTKVLADNGQYVPISADVTTDETLSIDSTNPIQNKAVATKFSTQYVSDHSIFAYKDGKLLTLDEADNTCTAVAVLSRENNKLYMIEKGVHEGYHWGEEGVDLDIPNSDFNKVIGKENSEILKSVGGELTIGTALNEFLASSDALEFNDWFIPSYGEYHIIRDLKDKINLALSKIEGFQFDADLEYWTSSESSELSAYVIAGSLNWSTSKPKSDIYPVKFIREVETSLIPEYKIDPNVKYVTFEKNIDLKECAYLNLLSNHIATSEDVGGTYDNGIWTSYICSEEEVSLVIDVDLEIESNRPLFLEWVNKIIPIQNVPYKFFEIGAESMIADNTLLFDGTVVDMVQSFKLYPYSLYTIIYQISTSTWELTGDVEYNMIYVRDRNINITSESTQSGSREESSSIELKVGGKGNTVLTNSGEYSSFTPGEYAGLYKDGVYAIDSDGNFISESKYDSNGTYTGIAVVIKGKAYQLLIKTDVANRWSSDAVDIEGLTNYDTADGVNSTLNVINMPCEIEKWPTEGAISSFDGKSNTAAILAGLDNTQDNLAKTITDFQTENGSEWFVPSVGQVATIYSDGKEGDYFIRTLYSKIYSISNVLNHYVCTSDELDKNYYWRLSYSTLEPISKLTAVGDYIFLKEIDFPQPLLLKEVPCSMVDSKLAEALAGILSSDSTVKSNAVDYLISNIKLGTKKMYLGTVSGNNTITGLLDHILITRDIVDGVEMISIKFANLYGWTTTDYPIYNSILGINPETKEISTQTCSVAVLEDGFSYAISKNNEQKEGILVSKKTLFSTFFGQFNTVTDITNLPIDKYGIKASLSTSQTLGFASTPSEGMEFMIDIKNTGSSSITISFPSTMQYDVSSIVLASGKIYSISVRYIFGTYCVRC